MTDAPAVPAPLRWQVATVKEKVTEAATLSTLEFEVPAWTGHLAGQHVDIRLTADDGYQSERSYSIASPPEDSRIALTVERLPDGEVSPYLVDVADVGDQLELRGPIGGWFTWQVSDGGPLMLIAGGSGLVPLMAMIRHRAVQRSHVPTRLLVSARTADDLLYADELRQLAEGDPALEVFTALTRSQPEGWTGYSRRVDDAMLREVAFEPLELAQTFVCGPTEFVEAVAELLVSRGYEPARVKTERFGATGGVR